MKNAKVGFLEQYYLSLITITLTQPNKHNLPSYEQPLGLLTQHNSFSAETNNTNVIQVEMIRAIIYNKSMSSEKPSRPYNQQHLSIAELKLS